MLLTVGLSAPRTQRSAKALWLGFKVWRQLCREAEALASQSEAALKQSGLRFALRSWDGFSVSRRVRRFRKQAADEFIGVHLHRQRNEVCSAWALYALSQCLSRASAEAAYEATIATCKNQIFRAWYRLCLQTKAVMNMAQSFDRARVRWILRFWERGCLQTKAVRHMAQLFDRGRLRWMLRSLKRACLQTKAVQHMAQSFDRLRLRWMLRSLKRACLQTKAVEHMAKFFDRERLGWALRSWRNVCVQAKAVERMVQSFDRARSLWIVRSWRRQWVQTKKVKHNKHFFDSACLLLAFRTWQRWCACWRRCIDTARAAAQQAEDVHKRNLFKKWLFFAQTRRRHRAAAASVAIKLMSRQQCHKLSSWHNFVASKHRTSNIAQCVICRLAEALQRRVWLCWHSYSDLRNRSRTKGLAVISRVNGRRCTRALSSLCFLCLSQRHCKNAADAIAMHAAQKRQDVAFQAWTHFVAHHKHCVKMGRLVVAQVLGRSKRQMMHTWIMFCTMGRARGLALQTLERRRLAHRLQQSVVAWARHQQEHAAAKRLMHCMRGRACSNILLAWKCTSAASYARRRGAETLAESSAQTRDDPHPIPDDALRLMLDAMGERSIHQLQE